MPSVPPAVLVEGEELPASRIRFLLGWVTDQEAIRLRIGRNANPGENVAEIVAASNEARRAVSSRAAYKPEDPVVQSNQEWHARLEAVRVRPEVQAHFAQFSGGPGAAPRWRPVLVDLRKVLSFQKAINVEDMGEQVPRIEGADALLEYCLPGKQLPPPQGVMADLDGKGLTVSSVNPNLRFAGAQASAAMVNQAVGAPAVAMQALAFFVSLGTSYLQVMKYDNRYFLRDGYHRSARLIRQGVFEVPCILIEAANFEEFGCPPGSLTYEVMYGPRPPKLTDFWDERVASPGRQLTVRKVVRVRVEEFFVPR
jgi:hypothetical protein